jgi:hypothetical protein
MDKFGAMVIISFFIRLDGVQHLLGETCLMTVFLEPRTLTQGCVLMYLSLEMYDVRCMSKVVSDLEEAGSNYVGTL